MIRILLVPFLACTCLAQPYQVSAVGEQRTIGLILNGADTETRVQAAITGGYGSLDHFFRATSHSKTWFSGRTVAVQVPMPPSCTASIAADVIVAANAAASAQGVDVDHYTRRMYIGRFPCTWSGLGTGGTPIPNPSGGTYTVYVFNGFGAWVHEMGHSFGLAHAQAGGMEYGDPTTVMGWGGNREFNAPHRVQLGWLTPLEVTGNGTYEIAPLEAATTLPQILKIGNRYLSYRQPIGEYDGSLTAKLVAGVHVHTWTSGPTQFLDTTSGSSEGFLDAPLSDGRVWSDGTVSVMQASHSPQSAIVYMWTDGTGPGTTPPPPAPTKPRKPRKPRG